MGRVSVLAGGAVRPLPARAARGLAYLCAFFCLVAVAVGAVGILGVHSTTTTARSITSDELATATATANVSRAIDAAYATGLDSLLTTEPAARAELDGTLFSDVLPAADTAVNALVALHARDGATELADIDLLNSQWRSIRVLLSPSVTATATARAAGLDRAFTPLNAHIARLIVRESDDAAVGQSSASRTMTSTIWTIVVALGCTLLAAIGAARFAIARVRRALRPEADQSEFADTMQLADDEEEAHYLLKRHLERAVAPSSVTVLNRNNSADRLEAMTEPPPGSPLERTLQHAEPRSCLAVRSGAAHRHGDGRAALLACVVCGECPGYSTCTPLTVGGEVIGSVLLTGPQPPTPEEEQRIRTSVTQAAPVLANVRNLAIAELRAATDSLTGLPNKRAVNDTLKRMLAQASRTLSPMALLLLDLDHFKEINDRFGHPVGDQALASVGAALASVLRESDFAGRNGGEEFAVILPGADVDGARRTAEKIRAAIAEIHVPGADSPLTASLGLAVYPDHGTSAEQLERLADAALYVAKRAGRDRTEVATGSAPVAEPVTALS